MTADAIIGWAILMTSVTLLTALLVAGFLKRRR
jgi:hypothetical protein